MVEPPASSAMSRRWKFARRPPRVSHRRVDGPIARIAVFGEVDVATAPELAECLREFTGAGSDEVVVDLTGLDFIDSAGLSWLAPKSRRGMPGRSW